MSVARCCCCSLAALPCLLLPAGALAMHPLATDDAGTLGTRSLQVEVASQVSQHHRGDTPVVSGAAALHVGLFDTLDVGATVLVSMAAPAGLAWRPSLNAPVVDAKWAAVAPDGLRPGLALRLAWETPLPADGAHAHGLSALAVASWARPAFGLHLNLGVGEHGIASDDAVRSLLAGARVDAALGRGAVAVAEVFADAPLDGGPATVTVMVGATWGWSGGPTLSAGAGLITRGPMTGSMLTLGVTSDWAGG